VKGENFIEIGMLQYDFDDGTQYKDVVEKMNGISFFILSSKNHLVDRYLSYV
jgi:hypothetical protein